MVMKINSVMMLRYELRYVYVKIVMRFDKEIQVEITVMLRMLLMVVGIELAFKFMIQLTVMLMKKKQQSCVVKILITQENTTTMSKKDVNNVTKTINRQIISKMKMKDELINSSIMMKFAMMILSQEEVITVCCDGELHGYV